MAGVVVAGAVAVWAALAWLVARGVVSLSRR